MQGIISQKNTLNAVTIVHLYNSIAYTITYHGFQKEITGA